MKIFEESIEKYFDKSLEPSVLFEMIARQLEVYENTPPSQILLERAKARQRSIRFPMIVPTEMSVGQAPTSEERQQFELWMGNIAGEGSAAEKLVEITRFFENPSANIEGASIPETLSYLMFMNAFTWMLKEFNPAVAGFMWEPFAAALFGGKSRQVPTSEGDIADIRIEVGGRKDAPISLKILAEKGTVKGSFTDLVKHFAGGGQEMRYVVVSKQQSGKGNVTSSATFWEFNITAENFFQWIGNVGHTEVIDKVAARQFKFFTEKGKKGPFENTGDSAGLSEKPKATRGFYVKHAKVGGDKKATKSWLKLAEYATNKIIPEVAEQVNLRNSEGPVREGELIPGAKYEVDLAQFKSGGKGGATLQKGYEEIPGLGTEDTKLLWGGPEGLQKWSNLAKEAQQTGSMREFFAAVLKGAPGAVTNKQFHISHTHYKNKAGNSPLGTLSITDQSVKDIFSLGADKIGEDLTTMFNSMAELTDNVGRFFLSDCGGPTGPKGCSKKDIEQRGAAGASAIENAKTLEKAVIKSVKSLK
tara:strand:- start:2395 stop:3987 length:1593 start_codon:yes stop_codon:yes gene_type:complete